MRVLVCALFLALTGCAMHRAPPLTVLSSALSGDEGGLIVSASAPSARPGRPATVNFVSSVDAETIASAPHTAEALQRALLNAQQDRWNVRRRISLAEASLASTGTTGADRRAIRAELADHREILKELEAERLRLSEALEAAIASESGSSGSNLQNGASPAAPASF